MTEEQRIKRIEQAIERYYEREGKQRRRRSYFRTSGVKLPGRYGQQKGFVFMDADETR